jgi:hypothetical protein
MQEQPHDADTVVALLSLFLESNLNEMKLGEGGWRCTVPPNHTFLRFLWGSFRCSSTFVFR